MMTMNKLYSNKALIIKAFYSALIPLIYPISAAVIDIKHPFVYIILSAIPIACLYSIQFILNLSIMRKQSSKNIKMGKYLLLDIGVSLSPSIVSILMCDIITSYLNGVIASAGFVTVIFISIFVILTLIFWGLYLIISKIK